MLPRNTLSRLLFAAGATLFCQALPARSDEPLPPTPGIDVLARGPIHEAFAQPVDAQPQLGPVVPKEPPAPLNELPPDLKPDGANVQWIPGYWQWDDERANFVWVSGFWRNEPPGRQWVPGYYSAVQGGYQWVDGYWAQAGQSNPAYQPQPPASVENGPSVPVPSDDAVYEPGNWVYQDSQYLWQPGFYVGYRPGWIWVPAHYVRTPGGFIFVQGYWDYTLADRGLLTAPIACDPAVCFRPGFVYRPTCAFPADVLTTALFVRPGWGHYYVGDYFGAGYRRAGFAPFYDARFGRGTGYDPLFAYYRAGNRGRTWERNLRSLYTGRLNGTVALPARTLVQQNALVRGGTVNVANAKNVALLAPLSRTANLGVRLTAVSPQQLAATRQSVTRSNEAIRQRRDLEAHVVQGRVAVRVNEPARGVVPKGPGAAAVNEHKIVAAPARPVVTAPAHVEPARAVRSEPPARIHDEKPPAANRHETAPAHNAPAVKAKAVQHAAAPVHAATPVRPAPVHTAPVRQPVQHVAAPARARPAARPAPNSGGAQPKRKR